MNRRKFVKIFAGTSGLFLTGASGLLQSCKSPAEAPIDPNQQNPLRIPTEIQGGILNAAYGSANVWRGPSSDVLTLNGLFTGPTVRVQKGDAFSILFTNALGEPSIIHWHGINAPSGMDGHPRSTIQSGAQFSYKLPIQQRAGTYWYHAHPDANTAKQVYKGFAGIFIIDDVEEAPLNLPSGKYDVPLLLQDKRQRSDNAVTYDPTEEDIISGFLGNVILANGTPNAYLSVEQTFYRFRLVNASNARVFKIGFSDGRSFQIIATDGGLLESPMDLTNFNLSPGERAEIIVNFSADPIGRSLKLASIAYDFNSSHRGSTFPQGLAMDILDCRVVRASATQSKSIPAKLTTLEKLSSPIRTRTFALTMDHSKPKGIHMINDLVFDLNRIDETVKQGDVELWEFQNTADAFHSMHVHGGQFQVSERLYAGPITPVDGGWKDTVLVYPNETVRVLVRFTDYKGLFLLHCHTLEHEDDGMMINVLVT
ncbi:MAG: multicopper oxidase family protein [Candidatus Kapaibacterium sp.]|jgi:blue copper oxidase